MLKPYNIADVAFQLGQEIGAEGRNSQVYIAHDPQLDAQLVIKKISKQRMDAASYFAESSCIYASSHSNVVPIHYACQDADHIYLAMPYYSNGSLKQLMDQRFLTVREIVIFSTQFLSGLNHIHSQRLVHFDIKPDNILLSERNEALVADFGLAKSRGINGLVEQDRLYGKMAPPESYQQVEYDQRYDLYQVGLTLFRMCVGDDRYYSQYDAFVINGQLDRASFRHAVINNQFPKTASDVYPEHIPEALIKVIKKCLQDLDNRYSSVVEIVNDLAPIEGQLLDWKYSVIADVKQWTKQAGDMVFSLEIGATGESIAKKGKIGGQERRIAGYCLNPINRQAVKRFLRET